MLTNNRFFKKRLFRNKMFQIVLQLINREISCHDLIETVESFNDNEYLNVLIELCQHRCNESSIICFEYLYKRSMNRWALDQARTKTEKLNER